MTIATDHLYQRIAFSDGINIHVPILKEKNNLSLVIVFSEFQIVHKQTGIRLTDCSFQNSEIVSNCFDELTKLDIPSDVDAIASDKNGINAKMSNIIKYWLEQDSDEEDDY